MATVRCAVLSPALDEVRISSAGHLPPIVAVPGQPAAVAAVAGDALLGLAETGPRQVTTLSFPPGTLLALYTDGLVERRGEPLDDGIARLRAALAAGEPEAAAAGAMVAMAGPTPHRDDVALLVLRRPDPAAGTQPPGPADPGGRLAPGPELPVAWSGRHAVVTMPAEIDAENSAGVAGRLAAVIGRSPEMLTADLTGTVFCDSTGIRALALARERAAGAGTELRLAVGDSPVRRMLQLTGLDQLMPCYRDARHSLATPRDQPGASPAPPA
jgi:anti-anti-sigma factor